MHLTKSKKHVRDHEGSRTYLIPSIVRATHDLLLSLF